MSIPESDDDIVTEEDLAEAQRRWADPKHESAGPELFARPVYGPGFRGDVPLGAGGASARNAARKSRRKKP